MWIMHNDPSILEYDCQRRLLTIFVSLSRKWHYIYICSIMSSRASHLCQLQQCPDVRELKRRILRGFWQLYGSQRILFWFHDTILHGAVASMLVQLCMRKSSCSGHESSRFLFLATSYLHMPALSCCDRFPHCDGNFKTRVGLTSHLRTQREETKINN
jgi:hypothetical protein